jgi:hypothetical protein
MLITTHCRKDVRYVVVDLGPPTFDEVQIVAQLFGRFETREDIKHGGICGSGSSGNDLFNLLIPHD